VHEKSVLLALAPASFLLLLDVPFFSWLQVLGCFTMFPLLVKDKLRIPYVACVAGYLAVVTLLDPEVRVIGKPGLPALKKLLREAGRYDSGRSWAVYLTRSGPIQVLTDDVIKLALVAISYVGNYSCLSLW
jgi:hypothetical protein